MPPGLQLIQEIYDVSCVTWINDGGGFQARLDACLSDFPNAAICSVGNLEYQAHVRPPLCWRKLCISVNLVCEPLHNLRHGCEVAHLPVSKGCT